MGLRVLAFAGSARAGSYNARLLAHAVELLRARGAEVEVLDLGALALPLYNADDEFDDVIIELPPPWPSLLDIVVTGYPDNRDPESLPRVP